MNWASERDTARVFSGFAAGLTIDKIPAEAIETMKLFIADFYAASFAGRRVNRRFNEAVLPLVRGMSGEGAAGVLAEPDRLPAEHAAFMNAVYAHGADMDDGNRKAMGHIAAHVMPAVFALAEELGGKSWADVTTALTVGYEVYNRLSAMAQPGLVHRGFHSTGTAGAAACGAACARLLGLNAEQTYAAVGIAAIQASGLFIVAESGQACKPLNPANAARTGILSAKLAAAGVEGPELPLESKNGWFHAMTDAVHYEMLDGLGETFTVCESYLKPYPSCRHTHCGIEAAAWVGEELRRRGLSTEAAERVEIRIYPNAIRVVGDIALPKNPEEAKFSLRFGVAAALTTGGYTLDDLERAPTGEEKRLTGITALIPDEAMENIPAGIRGARLSVLLADGTSVEKTVLLPKGDAANPFTWEDMRQKAEACMKGSGYSADGLIRRVRSLDLTGPFAGISQLLARTSTEGVQNQC